MMAKGKPLAQNLGMPAAKTGATKNAVNSRSPAQPAPIGRAPAARGAPIKKLVPSKKPIIKNKQLFFSE
jgi:hypothetical protein